MAICDDPVTEHIMSRESLGVCRINHLLRVQGRVLAPEKELLRRFDETAKETQERIFPGLGHRAHQQAALAVNMGGLGWRRAVDIVKAAAVAAIWSA